MRWTLGDAVVDLAGRCVRWPDHERPLTDQEAALLEHLALRSGETVTRRDLLVEVWGFAATSTSRAVDHAVRRLRTKIEAHPDRPRFLLTVRGRGYRLALPAVPTPEAADGLVGRSGLLRSLHDTATRHGQLTVIGPAGIGKTALVTTWARRHRLPVARLGGVPATGWSSSLARQLEVPIAAGVPGRLAVDRVGRALKGRGARYVVLDDVDDIADHVRELLDPWARLGLSVVLTCQVPLGVSGEALFPVPPLEPSAAAHLLLGTAALPPEASPLHHLLDRLGGHPLALRLASAQLRDLPVGAVLAMLDDPDGDDGARAAVSHGIARLGPSPADVLYVLALGPDMPLPVVAAVCGLTMRALQRQLTTLQRCAIVASGLAVPELVRRAILSPPRPQLLDAVASELLHSDATPVQLAAVAAHVDPHDPAAAARLWRAACRPMLLSGPVHLDWADQAVERSTGEERDEARVLRGALRTLAGDLAGASDDLAAATASREPLAIERTIRRGWLSLLQGDHGSAQQRLRDALRRARRHAHPQLEAMAEVRLASLTHRRGDVWASVRHLRRALGLYEALDEPVQASRTRANLAMMHVELGEHGDARQLLEEALASDRAAGVWAAVPQHLLNLGGLLIDLGELVEAEQVLVDARDEAVRFGDRETEGLALLSLGVVAMLTGRGAAALTPISRGRTLLQETKNEVGTGMAWSYEALACAVADAAPEGRDALEESRRRLSPLQVPALHDLLTTVEATLALAEGAPAPAAPLPASPLSFVRVAQRVYEAERGRRHSSSSSSPSSPSTGSATTSTGGFGSGTV